MDERTTPAARGLGAAGRAISPYGRTAVPPFAATAAAVAILYFAKDVFLPLATAVLLTFTLAPIVSALRRLGLSRVVAVLLSSFAAFLAVAVFAFAVGTQITEVARDLPTYQNNILEKVRGLKEAGAESTLIDRLSGVVERIGREIERPERLAAPPAAEAPPRREPVLVEVFSPQRPVDTLLAVIGPLLGPLATAGLVVVVVIFMLLEREDLRDRFIRLVGYGDLHRTTEALQDAGKRVGQYLLMQLVVNVTYGVPVGVGLWILGVPNAVLWGLLAIVLRFVPYIGPVIAMVLPLFLAFAVAPGWALVLWVAGLFIVVELISNNVIEPWLYGSRTGLSPLAIIVAAIFWTWLWGPVGLVLSTPLTVCLVVLGKHVPQFAFLEVLFGNEPVLDPKERLYQRLLAGDPDEATDQAEERLEAGTLAGFYADVAIPALLMAEWDRARGALTEAQHRQVVESVGRLVANLAEYAEDEAEAAHKAEAEASSADPEPIAAPPPRSILCVGGRGELDVAAAAMLAQALQARGAVAAAVGHSEVMSADRRQLVRDDLDVVVLGFLNANALAHGRFLVRRLKRARPALRVGVVLWPGAAEGPRQERDALPGGLKADFVAFTLAEAVTAALQDDRPGAAPLADPNAPVPAVSSGDDPPPILDRAG